MMQISDEQKTKSDVALFQLAFRPLFLCGGVFSCIA